LFSWGLALALALVTGDNRRVQKLWYRKEKIEENSNIFIHSILIFFFFFLLQFFLLQFFLLLVVLLFTTRRTRKSSKSRGQRTPEQSAVWGEKKVASHPRF
jgi:hypothetical protein